MWKMEKKCVFINVLLYKCVYLFLFLLVRTKKTRLSYKCANVFELIIKIYSILLKMFPYVDEEERKNERMNVCCLFIKNN